MHNRKLQIEFFTIIQLTFTKSTAKLRFKFFRKIFNQTLSILGTGLAALFFLYYTATYLPVHLYTAEIDRTHSVCPCRFNN